MKENIIIRGTPILGILGVILVVLKVLEQITLPWVWVLAPFWAPIALFFILLFVIFVGCMFWGNK